MKRLFFALPLSVQDKATLATWRDNNHPHPQFSEVFPDNFHITLQFLGQTTNEQMQGIIALCHKIKCCPFQLTFNELAYWPKPRVIYLTSDQRPQQLIDLVKQINQINLRYGFIEQHPEYTPHITLFKKAKVLLSQSTDKFTFNFDGFCLYESISTTDGVRYQELKRWSFKL